MPCALSPAIMSLLADVSRRVVDADLLAAVVFPTLSTADAPDASDAATRLPWAATTLAAARQHVCASVLHAAQAIATCPLAPDTVVDVARMQLLFDVSVATAVVGRTAASSAGGLVDALLEEDAVRVPSITLDDVWTALETPLDPVDWQMMQAHFEALVKDTVASVHLLVTAIAVAPPEGGVDHTESLPAPAAAPPSLPRFPVLPVLTRAAHRRPTSRVFTAALADPSTAAEPERSTASTSLAVLAQNTAALKSKALSFVKGGWKSTNWF